MQYLTQKNFTAVYKPIIPQNLKSFKWFVFPWFWGISKLPWYVLNGISTLAFFILYRILKYRIAVVRANLKHSFPNYSENQLKKIELDYYQHLSDLLLETIKGNNLHVGEIRQRVKLENKELLDSFYQTGTSAIIVLSHSGNWEWSCLAASFYTKMPFYVVYKPLSNKGFNAYIYNLRSKFGALPVSMNETLRVVTMNSNESFFLAMVGDQNPANTNNVYWTTFLNQETAFLNGPAKIAERYKLPIIYLKSQKTKRHHYVLTPEIIVDWDLTGYSSNINNSNEPEVGPNSHPPKIKIWNTHSIMNQIVNSIESEIREQPEIWLWSHRRWKHKKIGH